MQTLIHNSTWYWARASVGPYTVIASYITAAAAYGTEEKAWRQVEKRNFNLDGSLFINRNAFSVSKSRFEPLGEDEC